MHVLAAHAKHSHFCPKYRMPAYLRTISYVQNIDLLHNTNWACMQSMLHWVHYKFLYMQYSVCDRQFFCHHNSNISMIPKHTSVYFSTMHCTKWVASDGAGWACNVRKSRYDWCHRGSLLWVQINYERTFLSTRRSKTAGRLFWPRRSSSAEDLLVEITKVFVTTADEVQFAKRTSDAS